MKKIIFLGLVAFGLLIVPVVKAGWGRLIDANESINVGGATVHIIYDRQNKIDCYVVISDQLAINENRSNSIDCIETQ